MKQIDIYEYLENQNKQFIGSWRCHLVGARLNKLRIKPPNLHIEKLLDAYWPLSIKMGLKELSPQTKSATILRRNSCYNSKVPFGSLLGLFLEFWIPIHSRFRRLVGVLGRISGFPGKEIFIHPFSYSTGRNIRGFPGILFYFLLRILYLVPKSKANDNVMNILFLSIESKITSNYDYTWDSVL